MKRSLSTSVCLSLLLSAVGMGVGGCHGANYAAGAGAAFVRLATGVDADVRGQSRPAEHREQCLRLRDLPHRRRRRDWDRRRTRTRRAFQAGRLVGYAEMTRVDIGPQIGGQEYAELLVFRTKDAFDKFVNNNFTFAADASAVILRSGAAAEAKWDDDVAVFQRAEGGAFAGAAVGGQRFTFRAAN